MFHTVYRPESLPYPDTVVVSYYPLAGNDRNTGPRYRAEADLTGFDIIGIVRDGSDTTVRDPKLKADLSPANFEERWAERAKGIGALTADYDRVMVRGQSTGSFPSLAIVKTGVVKATHLVLEDGINLRAGLGGRRRSPVAARIDWLAGAASEALHRTKAADATWKKPVGLPVDEGIKKFATELYHWSPLWRSDYSARTALDIVESQPELAIFFKFVGHSATSKPNAIDDYIHQLHVLDAKRVASGQPASEVAINYDRSAWHSFLEYPQFGAASLIAASELQSFVR